MTSCIGTTGTGEVDDDDDDDSTDAKGEPTRGSMTFGVVASSMNWNISIKASSADSRGWVRVCERGGVRRWL